MKIKVLVDEQNKLIGWTKPSSDDPEFDIEPDTGQQLYDIEIEDLDESKESFVKEVRTRIKSKLDQQR